MTDPRVAALAAAEGKIRDRLMSAGIRLWGDTATEHAAAILAALPADWCGHDPMNDPLRVFGHAVGIILADRKVPDDWNADSLTPEQLVEGTARLLDNLDDATDAYTAGRVDPVDRTMQRDLRLLSATIARLRAALKIIAAKPEPGYNASAIVVSARNIARAALAKEATE